MANNLAERSGNLVETHKGYDPRTLFFYFVIAALLIALVVGLAYQQLFKTDIYHERERQQNQRRILIPGARGNIYDREGRLLVGNRARFSIRLHLDELRKEFLKESRIIRKNYRELGDKDIPSLGQMAQIARYAVVQRYLDRVNAIIGRTEKLDAKDLNRHFHGELLLPFTLIEDLTPDEYAKLLEQIEIKSPLQVYASSTRYYPYGAATSHVLGYVSSNDEIEADEDYNAANLATFNDKNTFKVRGAIGKDGIEAEYNDLLQGETGGVVYRVDPAGYRVEPPVFRKIPAQGKSVTLSLDIDLQQLAEKELAANELHGAAVAIDIKSGEVLTLASMPDYDLNLFSPRLTQAAADKIEADKAWLNRAVNGVWPPGSTFKILVSIAGLRSGSLSINADTVDCVGTMRIGNSNKTCDNGLARHGVVALREAIAHSCDIYFYTYGMQMTSEVIAAEARRFHLDRPTGIELPTETRRMIIPDPTWKKTNRQEGWVPGDTANMAIGQGFVQLSPLQMACFAASVARRQTFTKPTLEHHSVPSVQNNEPIGLTNAQYAAVIDGMEGCVTHGTAAATFKIPEYQIPGVQVVGKTGTAQYANKLNVAWFICFAPKEKPEIAVAVAIQSDTPGEQFAGGLYSAPIAAKILKRYFEKKTAAAQPAIAKPAGAPPAAAIITAPGR
ncbi:MAG: penicillin-binding transpeptidase domain-containing protein [Nibricoccus sp.]